MFISVDEVLNKNIKYEIYRLHRSSRINSISNIEKHMSEKVTIICQGGWKYTGILTNSKLSPFGKLEWLELTTKNATIKINSPYIVSIIYDNPIKSRKGTKGN